MAEDEYEIEDQDESNERRQRLVRMAEALLKKRDEAVAYRAASGLERRWREDEEAFDGIDETTRRNSMVDYATGDATVRATTGPVRSKVVVNIIRGKVETGEGRFSEIMLPVDDRNWGLKVTPVPELIKGLTDERQPIDTSTGMPMAKEDGTPVKAADIARAKMDAAEDRMKSMQDEIDDQLTECFYNGENRKVIRDAAKCGTGILKGPLVVKQIRKAWVQKTDPEGATYWGLEHKEEHKPVSKHIDYWNIYPDPNCGDDVKKAEFIWEYDEILPRNLRNLMGVEGYFTDQIEQILQEEPTRTSIGLSRENRSLQAKRSTLNKGAAYEKWEYHGDVGREDLEVLGLDVADMVGQSLSACVVFVNERPIKVMLNQLDTGDLPYDFFVWTQVKGSPFGVGISRHALWQQRVITAAWRAMMDNARDSSGANIVIGKGIEPADGIWELTGKKAWRITGDIDDVRKAFAQFQIESNQQGLQQIIELAMRFLDLETVIPTMFQGEKEDLPDTLGATNIMVDSNNVSLRGRVKLYDDQVTRPHITRYYHWNMQYNEKEEIKGDYNVDARGTGVLLARDQHAKALVNVMALRGDPRVDKEVDWGKAVRQLFEALRLNVLKSEADKKKDEEAAAQQPQQGDPKLEVAKIRSEGEMAKAELVQKSDMAELQFKAQDAERQRQHEARMKEMELEMKLMEFSQQSGLKLQEIKAQLSRDAAKMNLQRELSDKKAMGPQVASPPTEPSGRASSGRAYQE
jgi:hypothetical protein